MIASFSGSNRFLSNFWPCSVEFEGHTYPSVEHAYQAAKTLDPDIRVVVQGMAKAGEAKRYAKKIALRKDWGLVRV